MDFVNLPLFESWTEERDQLAAQRAALQQKAESGDMAWSTAIAEDAIVVRRLLKYLVWAGKIEPTDAEQEFERLNTGPLVPEPDPAKFDPMQEAHWTLEMSLAWIMWQRVGDVRRHWDRYRAEKKNWQFRGDCGHSLRSMSKTNYFELRDDELITQPAEDNAPRKSSDQARLELWRNLENGKLIAIGIDAQTEKRVEVPAREFIDLDLHNYEDGLFLQRAVRAGYLELRLPSTQIQLLWPERSTRNASLASAESNCRDWLEQEMRSSPGQPLATRASYLNRALGKFDGLSKEGFGRAWKHAINAATAHAWSKPGPRSKSKGLKSPGQ